MVYFHYLASALGAIRAVQASATLEMIWSTDDYYDLNGTGRIGPDGPWQAPLIYSILNGSAPYDRLEAAYVWPSGTYETNVLTTVGGGHYTASNATRPESLHSKSGNPANDVYDEWESIHYYNNTQASGEFVNDMLFFYPDDRAGGDLNASIAVNASIVALDEWNISLQNGRSYTPRVGILGLGPSRYTEADIEAYEGTDVSPSLLQQLKSSNQIASMFCGLHMGSASFSQPGSLVLGGYEQNRVLGDIGTFDLSRSSTRGPQAFILDVTLDVEIGASPFNESNSISVWHGINDDFGASEAQAQGGRTGSRIIYLNPSIPYMYLPFGICETLAQYLPITWDMGLHSYTWKIGEDFSRIVGSPAYMAIVLADREANNITIKIPFQVLNLTLESPIVDTPTQYFPCVPENDQPALGRAFLQAAFFGFEYENNLTFIAQAPGPSMEQSITKIYNPTDKSLTPNALGTFASSWAPHWTILASNAPIDDSTHTHNDKRGLSKGAIAGATVGSVVGALGIVAAAAFLWGKRKRTGQTSKVDNQSEAPALAINSRPISTNGEPPELESWARPLEAHGNAPPHEMTPEQVHEAPYQREYQELPVGKIV